jgi:hypothetical protein
MSQFLECVIIAYRILEWTWEDAYKGVGFAADIGSVSMGSIKISVVQQQKWVSWKAYLLQI